MKEFKIFVEYEKEEIRRKLECIETGEVIDITSPKREDLYWFLYSSPVSPLALNRIVEQLNHLHPKLKLDAREF